MARPKSQTATIKDIAVEARVSPSTVSRVLNNPAYDVTDALRSRVLSTAERLGYRPASRVRDSRIRSRIGVIFPNILNPMYAQALTGIETIARDYDCGVSVGISLRDREREYDYLSELFHRKILSIILSPVSDQVEGLKEFMERGMRVVLLDQCLPGLDCGRIDYDLHGGVRQAVQHLAEAGHARIGLAMLPLTRWSRQQVFNAFQDALARLNLRQFESQVLYACEPVAIGADGDITAGREIGERLAAAPLEITALVVLNGSMASGLLETLARGGVRVPEQLSVICLEDPPGAELYRPALTAIQLPAFAMGQMAATMLISKLGAENPGLQSREIRAQLAVRESTRRLDPPELSHP